eukprot:gene44077-28490_t
MAEGDLRGRLLTRPVELETVAGYTKGDHTFSGVMFVVGCKEECPP